jgi:hypothetical protein
MFGLENANLGHLLVSLLGICGGWLSVATRYRTQRFEEISVLELAARNPFRHNMGMLVSFCLAIYALIIFTTLGLQYLFANGSASAMFFSIQLEVNSFEWFIVHLLGWSAFFAGSIFFGLQEMDIAYIHYVARAEVLRVPNAPSLPRLDENGEPVEPATPEANDEEAGREDDGDLNPLERLLRKLERLEARLDQLEGDASAEE